MSMCAHFYFEILVICRTGKTISKCLIVNYNYDLNFKTIKSRELINTDLIQVTKITSDVITIIAYIFAFCIRSLFSYSLLVITLMSS